MVAKLVHEAKDEVGLVIEELLEFGRVVLRVHDLEKPTPTIVGLAVAQDAHRKQEAILPVSPDLIIAQQFVHGYNPDPIGMLGAPLAVPDWIQYLMHHIESICAWATRSKHSPEDKLAWRRARRFAYRENSKHRRWGNSWKTTSRMEAVRPWRHSIGRWDCPTRRKPSFRARDAPHSC